MSDEQFSEDVGMVERDLKTLKNPGKLRCDFSVLRHLFGT
jgi:hypothetical protein